MVEVEKSQQNVINGPLAGDNNYTKHAGVMVTSVLANSTENEFLKGELKNENCNRLGPRRLYIQK